MLARLRVSQSRNSSSAEPANRAGYQTRRVHHERPWRLSPPASLGTSFTGSPGSWDPPRTGASHGPQARSRVAAGDERSELALDGDEDRATSDLAGGSHVAGGSRDPGPAPPVVSAPSDAGGDKAPRLQPPSDRLPDLRCHTARALRHDSPRGRPERVPTALAPPVGQPLR
jgi:hypothetical protein